MVTIAGQADGLIAGTSAGASRWPGSRSPIALKLAGRARMRLATALGIAVHHNVLLRLVIDLPEPEITAAPEVLGVDDLALHRENVYATVLVVPPPAGRSTSCPDARPSRWHIGSRPTRAPR